MALLPHMYEKGLPDLTDVTLYGVGRAVCALVPERGIGVAELWRCGRGGAFGAGVAGRGQDEDVEFPRARSIRWLCRVATRTSRFAARLARVVLDPPLGHSRNRHRSRTQPSTHSTT